jgi:hypothetical protein
MPVEPVEVDTGSLAEVRTLVPQSRPAEAEPGILDAMTREAERLAALDPPFTDRTRERLRMLLGTC